MNCWWGTKITTTYRKRDSKMPHQTEASASFENSPITASTLCLPLLRHLWKGCLLESAHLHAKVVARRLFNLNRLQKTTKGMPAKAAMRKARMRTHQTARIQNQNRKGRSLRSGTTLKSLKSRRQRWRRRWSKLTMTCLSQRWKRLMIPLHLVTRSVTSPIEVAWTYTMLGGWTQWSSMWQRPPRTASKKGVNTWSPHRNVR